MIPFIFFFRRAFFHINSTAFFFTSSTKCIHIYIYFYLMLSIFFHIFAFYILFRMVVVVVAATTTTTTVAAVATFFSLYKSNIASKWIQLAGTFNTWTCLAYIHTWISSKLQLIHIAELSQSTHVLKPANSRKNKPSERAWTKCHEIIHN